MDCQAINHEDLAEKYLHHRLDAAQMDEFETHLLGCPMCTRDLELLQLVQADLAERAHEIRGWTAPKPHFFRWQVLVLAGIVIVVATASLVVRWQKMQTASVTAPPPPPQANPPVSPTTTQASGTNASKDHAKLENPQATPPDEKRLLPPSRSPRNIAPSIGAVPASGADVAAVPTQSNQVSVEGKNAPDNSVKPAQEQQQVATANSQPAPGTAKAQAQLSTEQGVELYKMAAVVPPPYTFSGLVSKGKLPDAHRKGGYSQGDTPSDAGRQLFQNAMAAYVEGRYGEASSFLEGAVQNEPNAADINFYLGVCKLLLGHPLDSIAPLKKAAAAGNSLYLQSSHYYLGKAYLQQEEFEEAERELHNAATVSGRLTSEAKSLLARTQTFRAQLDKK
jgi:TolA-binding protein